MSECIVPLPIESQYHHYVRTDMSPLTSRITVTFDLTTALEEFRNQFPRHLSRPSTRKALRSLLAKKGLPVQWMARMRSYWVTQWNKTWLVLTFETYLDSSE